MGRTCKARRNASALSQVYPAKKLLLASPCLSKSNNLRIAERILIAFVNYSNSTADKCVTV
jgi:hypothetical protein